MVGWNATVEAGTMKRSDCVCNRTRQTSPIQMSYCCCSAAVEDADRCRSLTIDWSLFDRPREQCRWVSSLPAPPNESWYLKRQSGNLKWIDPTVKDKNERVSNTFCLSSWRTHSKVDKCQYLDWERLIGCESWGGGETGRNLLKSLDCWFCDQGQDIIYWKFH